MASYALKRIDQLPRRWPSARCAQVEAIVKAGVFHGESRFARAIGTTNDDQFFHRHGLTTWMNAPVESGTVSSLYAYPQFV